jgi:PAS domain-containing protein
MKPARKTKQALTAELEALRTRLAQTEALLESLLSDRMPTDASSPGDKETFIEANLALQREIIHRREVEEALKDTEKRFRAIFEEAAMGIALVDLEGIPITTNRSLLELFGGSVDDLPPSLCNPLALRENGGDENEPPAGSRDYPVRDHHQLYPQGRPFDVVPDDRIPHPGCRGHTPLGGGHAGGHHETAADRKGPEAE